MGIYPQEPCLSFPYKVVYITLAKQRLGLVCQDFSLGSHSTLNETTRYTPENRSFVRKLQVLPAASRCFRLTASTSFHSLTAQAPLDERCRPGE